MRKTYERYTSCRRSTAVEEPKLAEELQKMPYEPLLPIEKKLILWSILLGVFLLGALVWVNQPFFHG